MFFAPAPSFSSSTYNLCESEEETKDCSVNIKRVLSYADQKGVNQEMSLF